MKVRLLKPFVWLLMITILLTGCASAGSPQPAATQAPAAATEAPQSGATQQLTKIKVSILPFLTYAPLFIAKEEGFYAEQGLDVEFVPIEKNSDAMAPLAQGQIDVASGSFDVSTLNAIAKGADIKYVSDKGYLDPNACSAMTFIVRKELLENGALKDPAKLKGMKVALMPASASEYALDLMLKDTGVTTKDMDVQNLPFPARLEAMKNGALDITAVSDPWTVRFANAGYTAVWKGMEQVLPNIQFSINIYGPNFLEKNPELGKKYMIAYLKGVRQYNQGKTDRNVEIVAKYTQMKPEEVKASCWMSMKADGMIDNSVMSGFQDWALARGFQVSLVPPEKLLDMSFAQYANEALK
jgi:NitT/TauT family transport system substrate-binding protein